MQYKTIVHELIQQHNDLHEQLRLSRTLLVSIESGARELKARHEHWKQALLQSRPGSHPSQIAAEALEIAVKELEEHLRSASPEQDEEALSLDSAMSFLHKPRGGSHD